ncbi:hypothetical protein [Photobacterium halotolerans]|uniref:Uncharacterized protein n=1 Tax=Photobacterium halotolerans TaxID=265726 RepID=A0A0F5VIS7_9GAMM|nr:hypothetical protein [Photobacterium halotolerans]KKD01410.1 hypothetical protein KY46_00850 [Photobacterium halotolerans]
MEEIRVKINSDGKPVPTHQFSEFFSLIRIYYILALDEIKFELEDDGGVAIAVQDIAIERVLESTFFKACTLSQKDIDKLTQRELKAKDELYLSDIKRNNPFEIVFVGISIALTAALIISGGKFELKKDGLKIELPPLGDGIKKLRRAFKKIK